MTELRRMWANWLLIWHALTDPIDQEDTQP